MGVYPFMFGATKDFQPVVDEIIQVSRLASCNNYSYPRCPSTETSISIQKDLKEPYDWDEYAQCFFPKAEELVAEATSAEKSGDRPKASELYLWVCVAARAAYA